MALNLWVDHKVRLYVLDSREENQNLVLIKDIEQELNITKSVASNLVKRMVQNGLVELEASPVDKRAKFVRLTDKSRSQMKQVKAFFERIDNQLMADIDEDELLILRKSSINYRKISRE